MSGQGGKVSYKSGTSDKGSLFFIERCNDINNREERHREMENMGEIMVGKKIDSVDFQEGSNYISNTKPRDQIFGICKGYNCDSKTTHSNGDVRKRGQNLDENDMYRLKCLLSQKNANFPNFTPYLHVRSDGQFSCHVDTKNENTSTGFFYLNITQESMKNDDIGYGNINDDGYENIKLENVDNSNDRNISNAIINDDSRNDCHSDNNSTNQKCEKSNKINSDTSHIPITPSSSRSVTDKELRTFFEDGFLKISNAVDLSRINSCLR